MRRDLAARGPLLGVGPQHALNQVDARGARRVAPGEVGVVKVLQQCAPEHGHHLGGLAQHRVLRGGCQTGRC